MGVTALAVAGLALGGSLLRSPQARSGAVQGQPAPQAQAYAQKAVPAAPKAASAGGGPVPAVRSDAGRRAEDEAAGPSKLSDQKALAYFASHQATKRVKDIRIVGGYLRIYTDLPESASNSKQALKLCRTGVDYLVGELGASSPVVFVQAKFGENGNPVLANVLGGSDSDCRVTHPKPGK